MAFYLARDLEAILWKLLVRFIKCSVLPTSTSVIALLTINLDDPNTHMPSEKPSIGHGAEKASKQVTRIFRFRMQYNQFLVKATCASRGKFCAVCCCRGFVLSWAWTNLKSVLNCLIAPIQMSEYKREVLLDQYTEFAQGQMHKIHRFDRVSNNLD